MRKGRRNQTLADGRFSRPGGQRDDVCRTRPRVHAIRGFRTARIEPPRAWEVTPTGCLHPRAYSSSQCTLESSSWAFRISENSIDHLGCVRNRLTRDFTIYAEHIHKRFDRGVYKYLRHLT